jgi:hypothetical protein
MFGRAPTVSQLSPNRRVRSPQLRPNLRPTKASIALRSSLATPQSRRKKEDCNNKRKILSKSAFIFCEPPIFYLTYTPYFLYNKIVQL